MLRLRNPKPDDDTPLSVLLVSAFGQANEWTLVQDLRAGGHVADELLAEDDDGLVGHVCLSRLDAPQGWLALGPVAVRTEDQGKGIGSELVRYALDRARQAHAKAVVVVGDPNYYGRFGFVFGGPARLQSLYPAEYTGLFPIAAETASAVVALAYPAPFADV
ncbi:GNAT family N-acetyltransferase [Meridianimarinicoccus sp. RP-17]|uniref:GNAT family N-acetyltransferase n=1 Tax=Meridianimarinicoccus zhengii TaxID=2056810 RepID=UPI0013A6EA9D|nr:N-acetyltransferase [Phycocomes zhengii]